MQRKILFPYWYRAILFYMRVISKRTLREFWEASPQHLDAQASLEVWHGETLNANWKTPQEIKEKFPVLQAF